MNKEMKMQLLSAAPVPDHRKKDRFVRAYRKQCRGGRGGTFDIIRSQMGYIRMPVWLLSLAALIVAVWGLYKDREVIAAVSAIMPFVSGIAVFDSARSGRYGMTELESVTYVSERGVLFARFVSIGIVHIALLLVLAVIAGRQSGYGYMMTGAMLTTPYLISSTLCMELERTALGRRNALSSIAVSAAVSGVMLVIQAEEWQLPEGWQWIWYAAAAVLTVIEYVEIRKTFRWEEYAWN